MSPPPGCGDRASRPTASSAIAGSLAFVVVATAVQLLRQPGVPMWGTVWAEDGGLFYQDALNEPLAEVLLRSYAGYAHVVPRLLADVGTHLPADQFARWAALSAAVTTSLLALFVYWASKPLLRAPLRRALLSASMLLLPVLPFETLGIICTVHFLAPLACLLAVLFPVRTAWSIAPRLAVVVLGPLSSPLCVLFAPVAIYQIAVAHRRPEHDRRRTLVVPVALLVASIVQGVVHLRAEHVPTPWVPLHDRLTSIAELLPWRLGSNLVFGVRVGEQLWERIGVGGGLLALATLIAVVAWKLKVASPASRVWIGALTATSISLYVVSIVRRPDYIANMVNVTGEPLSFDSARYEVPAQLLLVLALLVPPQVRRGITSQVDPEDASGPTSALPADARGPSVSTGRGLTGGAPWKALTVVAMLWFAVALAPSYRFWTYRSPGPGWITAIHHAQAECAAGSTTASSTGAEVVEIPIAPNGAWTVTATCGQIDAAQPSP